MYQSFICQYKYHDSEPIIGFCLNEGCNEQAKYCSICILHKHQEHKNDCQSIVQIKSLIKITEIAIQKLREKVCNEFEKLQELIKNILNSLSRERCKISELGEAYYKEEYQKLSDNVKSLKIYHQISKRIDSLCSVNYLDQLEKLHGFCKSLNSLSDTQSKMERNVSGEIDLSFILNQGKRKYDEGNLEEALQCFDQFTKIYPKDIQALIYKGCVLFELKLFKEAIQCFDIVLQFDRLNSVALNNKGLALISLQLYQEAIYCLNQAIILNPNDSFVQLNKGNALNNLNRKEEAKELIRNAIQKYPFSDVLKTHQTDLKIQILGQKSQTLEEVNKPNEDLQSQSWDFIRNNIMQQQNSNQNNPTKDPIFTPSTLQSPLHFKNQPPSQLKYQPQFTAQTNPNFQKTMQNSNQSLNPQRINNFEQKPPVNNPYISFQSMQYYPQNNLFLQNFPRFQTSLNKDLIKTLQLAPNVPKPIQPTIPQQKEESKIIQKPQLPIEQKLPSPIQLPIHKPKPQQLPKQIEENTDTIQQ